MNVPDNYDLWKQHDSEQQELLDKLPLCEDCGEPIQEDYCYQIGKDVLCESCMIERYQVSTDWFIDD